MKRKLSIIGKLLAIILAALFIINFSACTSTPLPTVTTTSGVTSGTTTITVTGQSSLEPLDFVSAVNNVLPSVVIIEDQQTTTDPFGRTVTSSAAGSGWILDANGIIVTNAHVVYNAKNIIVTLSDGRTFPAKALQTDLNNDLAVIKIEATGLPVASIGDSSKLNMGQQVAAVGNSLDMGVRITGGLVSRLNVTASYSIDNQNTVTFNDLIETDATINPGNSGGVLINMSGEVVGITNAGLSGLTSDVVGFGYAIDINKAMPILRNLASKLQ